MDKISDLYDDVMNHVKELKALVPMIKFAYNEEFYADMEDMAWAFSVCLDIIENLKRDAEVLEQAIYAKNH